jgi:Mg2+ and Co2+ transporter CorA
MNLNLNLPNNNTEGLCFCTNKIVTLEKEILEIKEQIKETNKINKELQESIKLLLAPQKGGMCSVSGNNYEKEIYNITSKCILSGSNIPFNTQDIETLGGSSSKNDIICNFTDTGDIGIEAKKHNTPDWMQCSIKYNEETKKWEAAKGQNPEKCRDIFNELVEMYPLLC